MSFPLFWAGFSSSESDRLCLNRVGFRNFFGYDSVSFNSLLLYHGLSFLVFASENVHRTRKQSGAIFIGAETAINDGIIALRIMIAKFGSVLGVVLMCAIWVVVYHTATLEIEFNSRAEKSLPLSKLSALFSGKVVS
jgi:hypothetical protein